MEKIMDLSIITPAAPNRYERIESMLERLVYNKTRNPHINFEYIIVDDSLTRQYMSLALSFNQNFPIKYISLPLVDQYPNPAYMRNVGFRVAEGKVLTMLDADHWVHEDFVAGVLEPFQKRDVLNTGFMLDTSKGSICPIEICSATKVDLSNPFIVKVIKANNKLIEDSHNLSFKSAMKLTGMNGPVACNRVWLAAYPRKIVFGINGYDEKYCMGYSREDDDLYYRIATKVPVYNASFKQFAGVHLWHPQTERDNSRNQFNKSYYNHVKPRASVRNQNHEWGKFVQGAFSIIGGISHEFVEHETWIEENIGIKSYGFSKPWKDFVELREIAMKKL
jgi:glycosyltransferase involved in cell wall biosynthesis